MTQISMNTAALPDYCVKSTVLYPGLLESKLSCHGYKIPQQTSEKSVIITDLLTVSLSGNWQFAEMFDTMQGDLLEVFLLNVFCNCVSVQVEA